REVELNSYVCPYRMRERIFSTIDWITANFPPVTFTIGWGTYGDDFKPRSWPTDKVIHKLTICGLDWEDDCIHLKNYFRHSCPPLEQLTFKYVTLDKSGCSQALPWKQLQLRSVIVTAPKQFVRNLELYAIQLQKIEIIGNCSFKGFRRKEEFMDFLS